MKKGSRFGKHQVKPLSYHHLPRFDGSLNLEALLNLSSGHALASLKIEVFNRPGKNYL